MPPTDTCSVLQSVEPEDTTRQANDCSSAANSGTRFICQRPCNFQSHLWSLHNHYFRKVLTNRFWPLFLNALTASKHVPFVHLGTESTNGCIIKKEVTQYCVTIV